MSAPSRQAPSSGKRPPLVVIGAHSRAGRAISRVWPPERLVPVHRGDVAQTTGLAVRDYRDVPQHAITQGCVVVNCVGTPKGTPAVLGAVNQEVPIAWAHAAAAGGARAFIQLSSLSVYGLAERIDRTTSEAPVTNYGASKRKADRALQALIGDAMPLTLLRIPMLFGDSEDKLAQLVNLCRRLRAVPRPSRPIERSMLSYQALAEAVTQLADRPAGGVLHLADPTPFSYDLLAERLAVASRRRVGRLPIPDLLDQLLRRRFAAIHARLLQSSRIAPDLLYDVTLPHAARLTTAIDRLAVSGGYP